MSFQKFYIIFIVGHDKCLRSLTGWIGGMKKRQKYAYVVFEWSLMHKINQFSLRRQRRQREE